LEGLMAVANCGGEPQTWLDGARTNVDGQHSRDRIMSWREF